MLTEYYTIHGYSRNYPGVARYIQKSRRTGRYVITTRTGYSANNILIFDNAVEARAFMELFILANDTAKKYSWAVVRYDCRHKYMLPHLGNRVYKFKLGGKK